MLPSGWRDVDGDVFLYGLVHRINGKIDRHSAVVRLEIGSDRAISLMHCLNQLARQDLNLKSQSQNLVCCQLHHGPIDDLAAISPPAFSPPVVTI